MVEMEDYNALRAHVKIDAHEKVCTERYGNIDHKLGELSRKVDAQGLLSSERLNALSNRMWAAAGAMLLLSVTGMAGLIVIILTRGLK